MKLDPHHCTRGDNLDSAMVQSHVVSAPLNLFLVKPTWNTISVLHQGLRSGAFVYQWTSTSFAINQSYIAFHQILHTYSSGLRHYRVAILGLRNNVYHCCILFVGTHPLCTEHKPDISELSQAYRIHSLFLVTGFWNTQLSSCHRLMEYTC